MVDDTLDLKQKISVLLPAKWSENTRDISLTPLLPDGSSRRFYRYQGLQGRGVVILPPETTTETEAAGLAEATSAQQIGRHLFSKGAPVPEVFAHDPVDGLLLVEDLGDQRLYDVAMAAPKKREALYLQVVTSLATMQVRGADGFNSNWCYDTPYYDQRLMLERESGYFLQALCRDLLALDFDQMAVEKEFMHIAGLASTAPAEFFLHRDFQSRNIMIKDGEARFIDYQGGRKGPLAYDLASLLIDPYAALPNDLQSILFDRYLKVLQYYIPYGRDQFTQEYQLLAIQRNLQILGAFAFLTRVRKKAFFTAFLLPAINSLLTLLAKPGLGDYPSLTNLAEQCRLQLEIHS